MAPQATCAKRNESAAGDRNKERRRKRPLLEHQGGIELPNIPGIPLEILPLHVQAIHTCVRLFQRRETLTLPFPSVSNEEVDSISSLPGQDLARQKQRLDTVVDVWMDRMDQTMVQTQAQSTNGRKLQELHVKKDDALRSWLESIRHWLRQSSRNSSTKGDSGSTLPAAAAPIAILKHLLDTIALKELNHSRHEKRRALTHLMGHLLSKSADCRQWLLDGSPHTLVAWMDVVVTADSAVQEDMARFVRLWQCESFALLRRLGLEFGDLYPTLRVALQRFEHFCPMVATLDTEASAVISELVTQGTLPLSRFRKLRDDALQQSTRMERRVRKLVDEANDCIDFLVPRMTDSASTSKPSTTKATNHFATSERIDSITASVRADNEDEEDDEDIAWEDGLDDGMALDTLESPSTNQALHAAAVERTLAVMKHTTGVLESGELEIDFAKENNTEQTSNPPADSVSIRERLQSIARILDQRYMGRLSLWLDALSQADSLVEVTREQKCVAAGKTSLSSAVAFVSMSQEDIQRRNKVFALVQTLKQEVASVLSSTRRLGLLAVTENPDSSNVTPNEPRPTIGSLSTAQPKKPALFATIHRRRVVKSSTNIPHKRNRIQIKYRKD